MQGVGQEIISLLEPILGSDRASDFALSVEYEDIVNLTDLRYLTTEVAQGQMHQNRFSLCEIGRIVGVCEDIKERYDAVSYINHFPLPHVEMFDFELFRNSQIDDDLKMQAVALLRLLLRRIKSDGGPGHKERLMPTVKVSNYTALAVGRKFQH